MEEKNYKDRIGEISMLDSYRSCRIALPIIMLFEVIMCGMWIYSDALKLENHNFGYLFAYIALFVLSGATYLILYWGKNSIEKRYRIMLVVQDIYAFFFVIWALWLTYLDAKIAGNFSVLILITILTVEPVLSYIHPHLWGSIVISSAVLTVFMAGKYEADFVSFLINFTVFTIMTLVGHGMLYRIRKRSYTRQIEMTELAKLNHEFAYCDSLTGLFNRRSFSETGNRYANDGIPANLVVAAFDVNGLKRTNDEYGHVAGDELLRGAAACIKKVYGPYGDIYRTGGDEFIGLLRTDASRLPELTKAFKELAGNWKGDICKNLSVSVGYSVAEEMPAASFTALNTAADNAMYKDKCEYYGTQDHNRRKNRNENN